MPTQAPLSSTTGTRLMRFSSMVWQQSSTDVVGVTVTTGCVIQSAAVKSSGLRSFATVRQTISRSVITPTGILLVWFSTTGINPQSFATIIFATSVSCESGVQHPGLAVITSLTFIACCPLAEFQTSVNVCDHHPAIAHGYEQVMVPLDGLLAVPAQRATSVVPARLAALTTDFTNISDR